MKIIKTQVQVKEQGVISRNGGKLNACITYYKFDPSRQYKYMALFVF